MGKYYDRLKTGDPNRKVSNQELLNVLGEFLEESIAILKQRQRVLFEEPKVKRPWWHVLRKQRRKANK